MTHRARTVADRDLYTGPPMPSPPRLRHALAAAAAALALAPAAAFAQGAGDDQYSDPFGSEGRQATPAPTPRAPARAATPAPTPRAGAPAATPAPAQATATAGPAAAAAPAAGPTLPYTGVDAWPRGLAGALLLGAGLTLRARLREPD